MRRFDMKGAKDCRAIEVRSFQVQKDLVRAAQARDLVAEACKSDEGALLFVPDLLDLCELDATAHLLVERESQAVLASCFTHRVNDGVYLSAMYCKPEERGNGFGGQVLDEAIAVGNNVGAAKISLVVRVLDTGLPAAAVGLYHSRGFQLIEGEIVNRVNWDNQDRHLARSADPGGTFRTRKLVLCLEPELERVHG